MRRRRRDDWQRPELIHLLIGPMSNRVKQLGVSKRMLRRASTRVLIGVVGVILLTCCQAAAAHAQGVSGYSEPTTTLSIPADSPGAGEVNCPSGEVVLSGGYYQQYIEMSITSSVPRSGGTGWMVSVMNNTNVEASVVLYAVCSQPPGSYAINSTNCRGTSGCTISCPENTSVSGGGYIYTGDEIVANGSYPSGDGLWSLDYSFTAGSIDDYAVCSQEPTGYVRISATTSTFAGLVNVPCPPGTVVIGGGGDEGPFSQNPGWNAPIAYGPTLENDQWSFGTGAGAPPDTGWAICAQPQQPTVSGVSPATGPVAGGTSVVITGTGLAGATGVSFGTAGAATSFTVNSATQITATSPPGTAGPVDVTVSNAGGTSATGQADVFAYTGPPTAGLTCTPGTVSVDVATQCVATVTSSAGPPTGSVSLKSDTTGTFGSSGTCVLSGSGGSSSCSVSYTPLGRGSGVHTITAAYTGSGKFAGLSASAAAQINVLSRSTSSSVSCVPSSVLAGQGVVCAASVTDTAGAGAGPPSGMVSFSTSGAGAFGGNGTCVLAGSGAAASCSVAYTPSVSASGTQTISANYAGDTTRSGSSGSTGLVVEAQVQVQGQQVVTRAGDDVSVGCSPGLVLPGGSVACAVSVAPSGSGSGVPSGRVVLAASGGAGVSGGGSCVLDGSGRCSVTYDVAASASGTFTVSASYAG